MKFQSNSPSAFIRAVHEQLRTKLRGNPKWRLRGVDSFTAVFVPITEKIGESGLVAQLWMERPRKGKAACRFEIATEANYASDQLNSLWRDEIAYSIRRELIRAGLPPGIVKAKQSTVAKIKLSVTPEGDNPEDLGAVSAGNAGEIDKIQKFIEFLEPRLLQWAERSHLPFHSGLEQDFHLLALKVYYDAMQAVGYSAKRYLQKVRRSGGVAAAKYWLHPSKGDVAQSGFLELVNHDQLELSLEAQVIREPWSSLFTQEEIETARARLARYGYFGTVDPTPRPEYWPSEEVAVYLEGKTSTISVNAYERNPEARAACIQHYGAACCICGFSFGEVYGADFAGYIHVHHICPLASVKQEYSVDPVADLRPVCPNCHAVIHRYKEPLTIPQLKELLRMEASSRLPITDRT
ncbi:MAG: hypothetical protein C0485_15175 [Pirellula sp.]|nr:hypothetical protein [Pirellula sp.]